MTPEQKAAYVMAQAACAMAEVAAMDAENRWLVSVGRTPSYGAEAFEAVITRNVIGHNAVLALFQS